MKNFLITVLILSLGCSIANAGWDDFKKKLGDTVETSRSVGRSVRDKVDRGRKKWKEKEHECLSLNIARNCIKREAKP